MGSSSFPHLHQRQQIGPPFSTGVLGQPVVEGAQPGRCPPSQLFAQVLMGSRLTEIVVDCRDPVGQAAWCVLRRGQVEIAPWEREPADLAEQVRWAPAVPTLVFVTVPEGKTRTRTACTWSVRPEIA